jgi:hypothetical protein
MKHLQRQQTTDFRPQIFTHRGLDCVPYLRPADRLLQLHLKLLDGSMLSFRSPTFGKRWMYAEEEVAVARLIVSLIALKGSFL